MPNGAPPSPRACLRLGGLGRAVRSLCRPGERLIKGAQSKVPLSRWILRIRSFFPLCIREIFSNTPMACSYKWFSRNNHSGFVSSTQRDLKIGNARIEHWVSYVWRVPSCQVMKETASFRATVASVGIFLCLCQNKHSSFHLLAARPPENSVTNA